MNNLIIFQDKAKVLFFRLSLDFAILHRRNLTFTAQGMDVLKRLHHCKAIVDFSEGERKAG